MLHHSSGPEGSSHSPFSRLTPSHHVPIAFIVTVLQPKEISSQPYQMAKKDGNGAACCKEDTATEDKGLECDRAQTEDEDEDVDTLTTHTVQETAL